MTWGHFQHPPTHPKYVNFDKGFLRGAAGPVFTIPAAPIWVNKTFAKVSYESRNELLKLQMSVYGVCQQEGEEEESQPPLPLLLNSSGGTKDLEKGPTLEIILKIGGQFINL